MRQRFVAVAASFLLAGCGTGFTTQPKREISPSATPSADPAAWVMSPDSFGPISMETTRSKALATGFYTEAPAPCSRERLDWRGQNYAEVPGSGDRTLAKPFLASITYDNNGDPKFVDPGKDTVTDRGIRRSDSFSRLQIVYGDDLIPGLDQTSGGGTFAVSGERSHLLFVVKYGKVVGFFLAAGHVEEPEDVMTVAGAMTKPDIIRTGRDGPC